jgi:hypothetical protein
MTKGTRKGAARGARQLANNGSVELLVHDAGGSIEAIDRRLDALEKAYVEGMRDVGELARLSGVSRVAVKRNYLPAVLARLARHADPAQRKAALALAEARTEGLMRETWATLLGEAKPGVRVQLGQILHSCHLELDRLHGIAERDEEHQRYRRALCDLLAATAELIESTSDRLLMQRFEHILDEFTTNAARSDTYREDASI